MVPQLPSLVFASVQQVEASYAAVSDLVFLLHPHSQVLLMANPAFCSILSHGKDPRGLPASRYFDAAVLEELKQKSRLRACLTLSEGKKLVLLLQVQSLQMGEESLLLCIGSETGKAELEDLIAVAEAEKKVLLNEVYHRVKNNLNIIISLLSLQLNRIKEPAARHLLLESKSRIFTLALLQERLYASPRLSELNAGEYLQKLATSVLSTFKEEGKQIRIRHQLHEDSWMNVDRLLPLGLIVHELVANAVQHAFGAKGEGEIIIELKSLDSETCQLGVEDNGSGLADPAMYTRPKSPTLGVQLVVSLVRQLKGSLQADSQPGKGTRVSIQFPKI